VHSSLCYPAARNSRLPLLWSIHTRSNLWEYSAFLAVSENLGYPAVNASAYFFVHDTTFCANATKFWRGLNHLYDVLQSSARRTLGSKPSIVFAYPSKVTEKNIGMSWASWVPTMAALFKRKFRKPGGNNKQVAIELEQRGIPALGKRYNGRGYIALGRWKDPISRCTRRLHYYPLIALYKHNNILNLRCTRFEGERDWSSKRRRQQRSSELVGKVLETQKPNGTCLTSWFDLGDEDFDPKQLNMKRFGDSENKNK